MDMAAHQASGPVTLNEISERQGISAKYLWQIVNQLKTAGLVRGVRGPRGGYVMVKEPESITLLDLVQVLEGPVALVECIGGAEDCTRADGCVAQTVWAEVNRATCDALKSITLAEVLRRLAGGNASHYVI